MFQKRHASFKVGRQRWSLKPDHPALVEGRPLFPGTVVNADDSPRLFISGINSRKLGRRVMKGAWAGMDIYQLSLPERTTCPRSCHIYEGCYGDAMPFARRHAPGPELELRICADIAALAAQHPRGFVVRLHVLGDFYSVAYCRVWFAMLRLYPALHIFGYTARDEVHDRDIFTRIAIMNALWPDRCVIRYSRTVPGVNHAIVLKVGQPAPDAVIICPAQTDSTQCCATCGLCWSQTFNKTTIGFIEHGQSTERKTSERRHSQVAEPQD